MTTVSVLVPLYNSAPTIERCLRSAMRQTLADIEILVGDDASPDEGAGIVDRIAAEDPRVKLVRFPNNHGKPRVMNRLASLACGEFLAVLDADDAYAPERLQRLVAAADAHGVELAADNLLYVDSGMEGEGFGEIVRTGFAPDAPARVLTRTDMLRGANTFAEFDFGILKPIVRRRFAERVGLAYREESRLAEDFVYLLDFFLHGGKAVLLSDPYYLWTMPFGARSRRWTGTGAGAWRYDYRPALALNQSLIEELAGRGETEFVRLLERRGRQYEAMIAYIDAQRLADSGRKAAAIATLARRPICWPLFVQRVAGRVRRALAASVEPIDPFAGKRVA